MPTKTEELASPAPARTEPLRILVADDQADVREALRLLLNGKAPAAYGIETGVAPSPAPTPAASQTPKTGVTAAATAKASA